MTAPTPTPATAEVGDITWYFTYGSNHEDKDSNSLGQCYTAITIPEQLHGRDRGYSEARALMHMARGDKWSMQYDHPLEAGVDRFNLVERTVDDVAIPAPAIDNTAAAEAQIKWKREHLTMQLASLAAVVKIIARLPLPIIKKCCAYDGGLDLDHLTRDESIEAMRILNGGKWSKSVNSHETHALNYAATIDGILVRLWAAAPPQTCRVEEYEEVIPEQRVIRRKLICSQAQPEPA